MDSEWTDVNKYWIVPGDEPKFPTKSYRTILFRKIWKNKKGIRKTYC